MDGEETKNVDENSPESILDVFSMEFESDKDSTPEPQKTEPKDEPKDSETTEEPKAPESQEQGQSAEKPAEGDEGEGKEKPVENGNEPSQPASKAPTSEELLAQAMKAISALSESRKPEQKAEEKPSGKSEEDADAKVFSPKKFEEYAFNISPKLYNGLFNSEATEEERLTCLQAYASGIATTVHNRILAELGEWTKKQFSLVPAAVNYLIDSREARANSQKSIREDFYGSFPELNKPELLPLIKATIDSVQKETGAKTWDKNFKTLVGNRVKGILGAYAQAGKPAPVAPKTTAPAATPAPNRQTPGDPNSPEAILDVFKSDF